MSNISRQDNSPHNPKLARYLHRIEQLVGNRGRSTSPLSNRVSKPIKHNLLDQYLKYQLTVKILHGFYTKKNNLQIRHFFNTFKQIFGVHAYHQHKTQKIYKFVPIEKTQCAHKVIDTSIGTKMLINLLKMKIRDIMRNGFQGIRELGLGDSWGVTLNTARSCRTNRSNWFKSLQKGLGIDMRGYGIKSILQKLICKTNSNVFEKLKVIQELPTQNKTPEIPGKPQIKYRYFYKTLQNLLKNKKKSIFFKLLIQKTHLNQNKHIVYFANLIKRKYQNNKKNMLTAHKQLSTYLKTKKYYEKLIQENYQPKQQQQQDLEDNKMKSTSQVHRLTSDMIYNGVSKINVALISIIIRTKSQLLLSLFKNKNKKQKLINVIDKIIGRKILVKLSRYFYRIKIQCKIKKIEQEQEYKQKQQARIKGYLQQKYKQKKQTKLKIRYSHKDIKWSTMNTLINIQKYLRFVLRQPYQTIKNYSTNKLFKQQNIKLIAYFHNRNILRQAFENLKLQDNKIVNKSKKKYIDLNRLQYTLLPKVVNKLFAIHLVQTFIKLKNLKKRNLRQEKYKQKKSQNAINIQWKQDIKSFISERDRFNQNLQQNYRKMEQMLNFKDQEQNLAKYQARKFLLSPKNKKINLNLFSK